MSKIDRSLFPPLSEQSAESDTNKSIGAWSRLPKILLERKHIERQSKLGGLWISRWKTLGDNFFSTYTCGWIIDIIDRPLSPNPWKEAETFFHWFTDEIQVDERILQAYHFVSSIYIQEMVDIFQEFRTNPPQDNEEDIFVAYWFITLNHYFNAKTTCNLALGMIRSGRRDVQRMVNELCQKTGQQSREQIESALRSLISWHD